MPRYSFEAIDAEGKPRQGIVEAETLSLAILELQSQQLDVRSIGILDEQRPPETERLGAFHRRLSRKLRERGTWLPALQAMTAEMPAGVSRRQLSSLIDKLKQEYTPEQFINNPDALVTLPWLTIGEQAESDSSAIRERIFRVAVTDRVRSRKWLVYPALLLALTASVLIGFSYFLIPIFREMYEQFGLLVPWPTRVTFWTAEQISSYLPRTLVILIFMVGILILLVRWWRSRALTNRLFSSWAAGSSRNLRHMSAFTSVLSELLALECPLPEALGIAGKASKCYYFERAASHVADALTEVPQKPLDHNKQLPPLVMHCLSAENCPDAAIPLLRELSTIYGERARLRRGLSVSVESLPLLGVILLGLLVGFVVVSLFMPLVTMVTSLA